MSQFTCEIEKTIKALKRYFDCKASKGYLIISGIKVKLILFCSPEYCMQRKKKSKHNPQKTQYLIWDDFEKKILCICKQIQPKKLKNNLFGNSNAVLFYTTEKIPRGDYVDSKLNQSRAIREYFENTIYAKTANYRNLIEKIKELILEVKLGGEENL